MTATSRLGRLPLPGDFEPAPGAAKIAEWTDADRAAQPTRLDRIRTRLAAAGLDAYFGTRSEHSRYLTGFSLADGEDRVAGTSGWFLVSADEVVVFADTRYEIQARREAPDTRIEPVYGDLEARWPELVASVGARQVAGEAGFISQATWARLATAAPEVEIVPVENWIEVDRATKEPSEIERIAAACAVSDRALAALLPKIGPGVTERELALDLEWLIRTGGGDALAFDVACLAGPEAALPHGSPGDRPVQVGAVLLFDFGAQVAGYRSDMTRTLFIGEPRARDLELYELVAEAQRAAIAGLETAVASGGPMPSGKVIDALARDMITKAGHGAHFGHGTGHGIGLATHEEPFLSRRANDDPLPSPTVFSVEPGIYLEGETGIRLEDLIVVDLEAGRVDLLTQFPNELLVIEPDAEAH